MNYVGNLVAEILKKCRQLVKLAPYNTSVASITECNEGTSTDAYKNTNIESVEWLECSDNHERRRVYDEESLERV